MQSFQCGPECERRHDDMQPEQKIVHVYEIESIPDVISDDTIYCLHQMDAELIPIDRIASGTKWYKTRFCNCRNIHSTYGHYIVVFNTMAPLCYFHTQRLFPHLSIEYIVENNSHVKSLAAELLEVNEENLTFIYDYKLISVKNK